VDIGRNEGDFATLSFALEATFTSLRLWDIKITQLEPSNPAR
jgi:hypothetical protein